jgi:putative ABC transport system permease protein
MSSKKSKTFFYFCLSFILGIFIGIAAVVALISMGQGLEAAINGQFGALSVDKLTIQNKGTGFGPPGSTVIKKLTSHDIDIIKKVNGVDFTVSKLLRITKVEFCQGCTVLGYSSLRV